MKRDIQRKFLLDKGIRDALADECTARWKANKAKNAAKEWGLTLDEGRSLVAGRASITTVEKILKNGGWSVELPVMAAVIGQAVDQHLIRERRIHAEHAARLGALVGHPWTLDRHRPDPDPDLSVPPDERGRTVGDRTAQGQG